MTRRVALMSLKPAFSVAVLDGRKRFEYRRARVTIRTGDVVLLYESAPTSLIVGVFRVGRVVIGDVDTLLALEPGCELSGGVATYLRGARTSSAIEVLGARRLGAPIALRSIGLVRPPQSYCFVPEEFYGRFCDHDDRSAT